MKKVICALKVALLYVGTMVGAGFATGQEIQLYFYATDLFTVILSSAITALFCMLTLYAGKLKLLNSKSRTIVDGLYAVAGILTAGIMLSGIKSIANSPFIVLISLSVCMLIAVFGNKAMKIFNAIAVPLIVIAVTVSAFVNGGEIIGEFSPVKAIAYSAMNVFFESVLMYDEGEKMDGKEILITGTIVAVVIFALIYGMRIACMPIKSTMPYLSRSRENGLTALAYLVVILAIYSTIVNCLAVTFKFGCKYFEKSFIYSFVFVSAFIVSVFSFEKLVEGIYPIFSYLGIAFDVYLAILLIVKAIKNKRQKRIILTDCKN